MIRNLNDSRGPLCAMAAQMRDKAANAKHEGKIELQELCEYVGDQLDEALGIGIFKAKTPDFPKLDPAPPKGWIWSINIPDAMRFVAISPRPHFQRKIRGLWQLLLPHPHSGRNAEWTLYSGAWPDVPDLTWEKALEEADRASDNTGRS